MAFVRDAVRPACATSTPRTSTRAARASARSARRSTASAEDVLVATKGGYRAGEGRPEVLRAQIEQSLRSLRTEAIGLYYLHRVDPETPLEESLGAIKAYVDRGAIRHVGISEVSVEQIERARRSCRSPPCRTATTWPTAGTMTSSTSASARGSRSCPYFPLRGDGGPGVAAAAGASA